MIANGNYYSPGCHDFLQLTRN